MKILCSFVCSLIRFPARERHSVGCPCQDNKLLATMLPLLWVGRPFRAWGSASEPLSCSVPRKPGEGRPPLCSPYLGHRRPLGFRRPVLAVTFTPVCHGDLTHSGQRFFDVLTEKEREFRRNSPECTKCQTSHSWLRSIPRIIPDSTGGASIWVSPPAGGSFHPTLARSRVSASFSVLALAFPLARILFLTLTEADFPCSPHLEGEVLCGNPFFSHVWIRRAFTQCRRRKDPSRTQRCPPLP